MADDNVSLKDSVLNAFNESEKAAGSVPVEEAEVKTEEKIVEDKKEEVEKKEEETPDEVVEIDASAEDIRSALALQRALNDPNKAKATIEELAKIGGYDLSKKQEVKQLQRDTKTILKEKLGDSYDLLSGDALAAAFDILLEGRVKEITEPALTKLAEAEVQANTQKANTAMDALWVRNNISDPKVREEVAGRMLRKMEAMPASAGTDINEYLDDIYTVVNRDTEKARTVKKVITKIKTNAHEVVRTSGEGSPDDERVRSGSKLPSLKESVSAAFRGEKLQ
jgi:hypothetical protein